MRSTFNLSFFLISILTFANSCKDDKFAKIQGIYKVDKDLLRDEINKNNDTKLNDLNTSLISAAIQNASIELQIIGDSINGIIFLMGNGSTINSKIILRNDTLVMKNGESEFFLFSSAKMLNLLQPETGFNFTLLKTDQLELSQETKIAIDNLKKNEKDIKEFNEKIGKWQIGNYVDEFGDKTNENFVFTFVKGSHENSIAKLSDVYVKIMKKGDGLYFAIYNNTLTKKESLPNKQFGDLGIKYLDGTIKYSRVFFLDNSFSEAYDNHKLIYDHIFENTSPLKILLDLGSETSYYTDKYVFEIEQNNLLSILKDVDNLKK